MLVAVKGRGKWVPLPFVLCGVPFRSHCVSACVRVAVIANALVSLFRLVPKGCRRVWSKERRGTDLDFAVRPKVDAVGQIAEGVRVVADEGARKVDVLQAKALVREGKQERMSS